MDLVSIRCPSFVLSPYSYLEARTDYIAPLPCLLNINHEPDALNRFLRVCQWVISSLTFIPSYGVAGVKPYNPVLGERYSCIYTFDNRACEEQRHYHPHSSQVSKYSDSTYAYAEQVSHHPPITSQYMCNEQHQFVYTSTTEIQVKFRGTFVETQIFPVESMLPHSAPTLTLTGLGETYTISYPHIVVTGLFWGTTQVSNEGKCEVACEKTGLRMTVNCSSKKHAVEGEILQNGRKIMNVQGALDKYVDFTSTATKRTVWLIDAKNIVFPKKLIRPLAKQDEMESRKVWDGVTRAIQNQDFEQASREKCAIEEKQRLKRSAMDIDKYEPCWWSKVEVMDQRTGQRTPCYVFKGQQAVNALMHQNASGEAIEEEYQCLQNKDSFNNYARRRSLDVARSFETSGHPPPHFIHHGYTPPFPHNASQYANRK